MQYVVHALHGTLGERQVGEVSFEELDTRNVIEVGALARDETVRYADRVPAADEFFGQVRSNEPGSAGDEVMCHAVCLSNIRARLNGPPHSGA